jgi:hypothetical protein
MARLIQLDDEIEDVSLLPSANRLVAVGQGGVSSRAYTGSSVRCMAQAMEIGEKSINCKVRPCGDMGGSAFVMRFPKTTIVKDTLGDLLPTVYSEEWVPIHVVSWFAKQVNLRARLGI